MGKHLVVKHIVLRDHQHRLIPKLGNLHFCPLCKPVIPRHCQHHIRTVDGL